MTGVCHTRPSGAFFGLAQLSFFQTPAWKEMMALPTIADRVDVLRNVTRRNQLIAEAREAGGFQAAHMLHPLGMDDMPNFDLDRVANLQQLADEAGKDPVEVYVERLLESEGREFYNYWAFGGALENQWKYMQLPHIVPMLGDSGAHVGIFTDADSPTFLLNELTRQRSVYSLPEAIHRITGQSADVLGLKERGLLKEGWHADINIIDYEQLASCHPEYVNDFPHNGGRFIIKSKGYLATIVGGQIIIENGQHTGQRPGQVIREFHRG